MLLLITGLIAFLLVSGASDTRWGRGVRGGLSGGVRSARDNPGSGVRDRVSGAVQDGRAGFLSGWSSPPSDTHRTVGQTGQRTLLQRLSGRAVRGVRTIMGRVSGRTVGFRTPMPRPMLLNRPDGTAEEFRWDEEGGEALPRLRPGERIFWLNEYGSVDHEIGSVITYEDQQPGGFDHIENAGESFAPSRFEPQYRCGYCKDTKRWPSQEETCPWCTGALSLVYAYKHPNGEVYSNHIGWSPGDPIPDAIRPFAVMDPKSGNPTGKVTAAELRQMSATAADPYPTQPIPAVTDTAAPTGGRVTTPMQASAIETLPQYRQYMTQAKPRAIVELEDAKAGADRLQQQALSVAQGVERLIALRADPATAAEGHRVVEAAQVARDAAQKLAAVQADLVDAIDAAIRGAARHDTVQEAHDSGVHLERAGYDGN